MPKQPKKQPEVDAGLDIIKRFKLLTIALIDAAQYGKTEEFTSLFHEREQCLDALSQVTLLSSGAIREMNVAYNLDEELQKVLKNCLSENVQDLTDLFKNRDAAKAYRTTGKTTESGTIFEKAS